MSPRRRPLLRLVLWTVSVSHRSLARFIALEGFDRAMALAGQAFAAMLPLLLVVSAVSPRGGDDLADELVDRFELKGSTADTLHAAVGGADGVQVSVGVLGMLLLLLSALSFTRAMQRLYVRAWGLGRLGLRGNLWGLLWILAFILYWSIQPVIVSLLSGVSAVATSLALNCALWLFTPWLLVGRSIPWRRLFPQALLTAVALAVFGAASVIYMPHTVGTAAAEFGFIGVAFSLLSWLFVACWILVATAALGATLVESPHAGDAAPAAGDDDGR
jgi:membrane protein